MELYCDECEKAESGDVQVSCRAWTISIGKARALVGANINDDIDEKDAHPV